MRGSCKGIETCRAGLHGSRKKCRRTGIRSKRERERERERVREREREREGRVNLGGQKK